MLYALGCYDHNVLAQITFAQQQIISGGAAATGFEAIIAGFVRFDLPTLLVSDGRVDAAVRLRCSRRSARKSRNQTKKKSHLVEIAFAFATGVIDVDHLQLRVEVERGGTLFAIADACAFRAAKGNVRLTTGRR